MTFYFQSATVPEQANQLLEAEGIATRLKTRVVMSRQWQSHRSWLTASPKFA
jgi:hypothetical protein